MRLFALLLLFLVSCSAPKLVRYEKPIIKYSNSNYLTVFENKDGVPSNIYLKVLDSTKDREFEVLGVLQSKKSTLQKRYATAYNLIKLDGEEVFVHQKNLNNLCAKNLFKLNSEIIVGKDSIDIYWSRAVSFVTYLSRQRINIQTDLMIDTYVNPDSYSAFGYNVTKEFLSDGRVKIYTHIKSDDRDNAIYALWVNYFILYGTTCEVMD